MSTRQPLYLQNIWQGFRTKVWETYSSHFSTHQRLPRQTSACWWRWQLCPLDTVQRQNQTHIPESHRTVASGGTCSGTSNSARICSTWPAPEGKDMTLTLVQTHEKGGPQILLVHVSLRPQCMCTYGLSACLLTASEPCIMIRNSLTALEPRYLVLVSDRSPVTVSRPVRSSTPF